MRVVVVVTVTLVSVVTSVPVLLLPVGLVITNPVMAGFHFKKF